MACSRLAVPLAVLGLASALLASPAMASAPGQYVDASIGETPNAVAVADNGAIAASLFDAQAVALVDTSGTVRQASLGCSPHGVAMAPSGQTAWAVCQSDQHVHVVDVASGEVSVASVGATGLDEIVYLPAVDQLLIASIDGQIIEVSDVSAGGYLVTKRVVIPEWHVTELAPYPNGELTYAITDAGDLILVRMESGGRVVALHRATPERSFLSIDLNRWTTSLYAAVVDSSGPTMRTSIELIDVGFASARQSVDLEFTLTGATNVQVSAGYRGIYVSAGLLAQTSTGESGLLELPISERGVLGPVKLAPVSAAVGSGVGLSHSGGRVAFGTTNSTVVASLLDDRPYAKAVRINASTEEGVLRIRGMTTSLSLSTRLNVYVKDLTVKRPRFIKQKKMTVVTSRGTILWRGKAPSERMAVYVAGEGVSSATITVTARP